MIKLYSGTPGSGKSLHLAEILYYRIKNTKTITIGNFPINTQNIRGHKRGTYLHVDNTRLDPQRLIDFSNRYRRRYGHMKEGTFLLVIDEAQILFNSREWQMSNRNAWLSFFTQHRKLGFDVILVAQFDRMLDRQIRALFEYEWIHRKCTNFGIVGKIISLFCGGSLFVCVKVWYPLKEKTGSEFFRYHKKYAGIYDTFNLFRAPDVLRGRGVGSPPRYRRTHPTH